MRKLLFAAYFFPPVSTGSAPRNIRLARYLHRAGWDMAALTVENPRGIPVDGSLLEHLPDETAVYRASHRDPVVWLQRLRNLLGSGGRSKSIRRAHPNSTRGGLDSETSSVVKRLIYNYLLLPDRAVTWVPSALRTARRLVREVGPDLVMSAGPPHSTHILGYFLRRTTGLSWVAYFGDLWTIDSYIDWKSRSGFNRRVQRLMEEFVVRHCDGIVTTTESSSRWFQRTYARACPPVATVMNGYDPTPVERACSTSHGNTLQITYAGFFMGTQTPEYFLGGLSLFRKKHPDRDVRFTVAGDFSEKYASMPGELGIEDIVEVTGRLPYSKAIARMRQADILLACLPPFPGSELKNPAKTAEYIQAGGSILAVCPEGELTGIIDRLCAGYIAAPDSEDVLAVLETVWSDWRDERLRRARLEDADSIFDMRDNCERLAEFLDGFLDNR